MIKKNEFFDKNITLMSFLKRLHENLKKGLNSNKRRKEFE